MSEHDEAGGGAGAHPDVRARLGDDFAQRLVSGLAMGAVAALCTFLGAMPFAVLVVVVTMLLSWEWGRLVHGREGDVVIAVHAGAAVRCGGAGGVRLRRTGAAGAADRCNSGDVADAWAQQRVLGARGILCRPACRLPDLAAIRPPARAAGRHLCHCRRHHHRYRRLPHRPADGWPEAVAARLTQQDLGRPGRRAGGELDHRRPVLVCRSGKLGRAAGGNWGYALLCGAGRRPCRNQPSSAASGPRMQAP